MKKQILFLLITCLFISCKMDVKDSVCISGSISFDEEIVLPNKKSARSAFPTLPDTVFYEITAEKGETGEKVTGTVNEDLSFSVTVESGFTGKIKVTGYKVKNETGFSIPILEGQIEVSDTTTNIDNLTITVFPSTGSETGTVKLPICTDCEKITWRAKWDNSSSQIGFVNKFNNTANTISYFTMNTSNNSEEVPVTPGTYNVEFSFYRDKINDTHLILQQTINVSPNMQTSTWVNSASAGQSLDYFREMEIDGKTQTVLYITEELMEKYKNDNTIFYVKQDGNDASGNGTFLNPFATPQKAMEKIKTLNESDSSKLYTIIIDGEIVNTTDETMLSIEGIDKPISVRIMGINYDTTQKNVDGVDYDIPNCKLNANEKSRVISIAENATVTIGPGVTITGGAADFGGGIYNEGTLFIKNAAIVNNVAMPNENNSMGAGLYNTGTCTIGDNSIILNNEAKSDSTNDCYGFGGGIANLENGELTLDTCIVANNKGYYGGGILNFGKVYIPSLIFNEGCQIINNKAEIFGAGIMNIIGNVTINNANISGNILSGESSCGGGIYHNNGDLTIKEGSFLNNKADIGGAIFIAQDSKAVIGNAGASSSDKKVFFGTVDNGNKALYGGAIYIDKTTTPETYKTIIYKDCEFNSNVASVFGGALSIYGGSAELNGVSVINCSVSSSNGSSSGGGIYVQSFSLEEGSEVYSSNLLLDSCSFENCYCKAEANGHQTIGGAICSVILDEYTNPTIKITNTTFKNCYCDSSGADSSSTCASFGGAIYSMNKLTSENNTYNECYCKTSTNTSIAGGALYLCDDTILDNNTFENCYCDATNSFGQSIFANACQLTLCSNFSIIPHESHNGGIYLYVDVSETAHNHATINLAGDTSPTLSSNIIIEYNKGVDCLGHQYLTSENPDYISENYNNFVLSDNVYSINSEGKIEGEKIYDAWNELCSAVMSNNVEGQVFYITGTLKADKPLESTKPIKIHGVGDCVIKRGFINSTGDPIFEGNIIELKGESESSKITIDGCGIDKQAYGDGTTLYSYKDDSTGYMNYSALLDNEITRFTEDYLSKSSCFVLSDGSNAIETVTIENVIFRNYAAADCTFIYQASSVGGSKVNTLNIINCVFENNISYFYAPTGAVLGIDNEQNSCNIINCIFKNNLAISTSLPPHGGAIAITKGNVTIKNVTAENNKSGMSISEGISDDIYIEGNNDSNKNPYLKFFNENFIDCLYVITSPLPKIVADGSILGSKINLYIYEPQNYTFSSDTPLLSIENSSGISSDYSNIFIVLNKSSCEVKDDYKLYITK